MYDIVIKHCIHFLNHVKPANNLIQNINRQNNKRIQDSYIGKTHVEFDPGEKTEEKQRKYNPREELEGSLQ